MVDPAQEILDVALHINGEVEVDSGAEGGCTGCHGGAASPAPPVDTQGGEDPTARGVGAQQAHVLASANHAALGCGSCHVEPATIEDAGHKDTPLPAEVTFGGLATAGGAQPAWDGETLTCSGTYCHALDGGGNPSPAWNQGQRMVCGSCHGLPPVKLRGGGDHPGSSLDGCVLCHAAAVDAEGKIVSAELHVNGTVDLN